MITKAFFEDIQDILINELEAAEVEVLAAIAWFTNVTLFKKLIELCENGVNVELIINCDEINLESSIDYNLLNQKGGSFQYCEFSSLMHNKFLVIDRNTVINGSYNWTNRAKYNHETITLIKDAEELAQDFAEEFHRIKSFISKDTTKKIDKEEILLRIDIINNFILLKDKNSLHIQLKELEKLNVQKDQELSLLINDLKKGINSNNYSSFIEHAKKFSSDQRSIRKYIDYEYEVLIMETESLKFQMTSLENEISETERMLSQFHHEYNLNLGPFLLEILRLEKELSMGTVNDFTEAERKYNDFYNSYTEEKKKIIHNISEVEENKLKKLFRKASKLCHPDLVEGVNAEFAINKFIELKTAYDNNDLIKVESICKDLECNASIINKDHDTTKEYLKNRIIQLNEIRDELETTISELRSSESYILMVSIGDWSEYFETKKSELANQLEKLKIASNED